MKWLLVFSLLVACGDDDGSSDGGLDGAVMCTGGPDCDDGFFCNGVERCDPASTSADARGCVAAVSPCTGDCDETLRMCAEDCRDADGDGQRDAACGGADCDDDNPNRYGGAEEICDAAGVDEDCDPNTLGPDADGDGFVDDACCNERSGGMFVCGDDCDDSDPAVHPGVNDICGNGDEDCDGATDENPNQVFYRDADGDGFGVPGDTILACAAGGGYVLRDSDCDDDFANINPDEEERCGAALVDEDCDGAANEGCSCTSGEMRACPGDAVGTCTPGVQQCLSDGGGGTEWSVCVDRVEPADEFCDSFDNDCDGDTDEDFECTPGQMETGTNACGRSGCERVCTDDTCAWATRDFSCGETAATCDYCDDTGSGPAAEMTFASASRTYEFLEDTPLFLGHARFVGGRGSNTVLVQYDDAAPRVGGAFSPTTEPIGYGGAMFAGDVVSGAPAGATQPLGDGWAFVAVIEGGALVLGPGGAALGVPRDRDGFALEWRRYQEDDPSDDTDSLVLRRLSASGIDPVIVRVPNPASVSTLYERVELVVMPDRPGTTADETEVRVRFFTGGAWSAVHGCGAGGTPCGLTVPAGSPMRFGVTAAVGAGRQETYSYKGTPFSDQDMPSVTITGLCP